MKVREIILFLVAFSVLYYNTPEKRLIRSFNRLLKDFIINYYRLNELLDKKYDMKQILQHFGVKSDEIEVIEFDFGSIDYLQYADTTQLRNCFLLGGEYIIRFGEVLKERYSFDIDSYENYLIAMEILKDVRHKTMMLNEDASFVLMGTKTK